MDTLGRARRVLSVEISELERLAGRLDEHFTHAVKLLREAIERRGKIVVLGVGKSGHIGEKIAATLTSTGAPAVVLDSLNALHGDLGVISDGDVILTLNGQKLDGRFAELYHDYLEVIKSKLAVSAKGAVFRKEEHFTSGSFSFCSQFWKDVILVDNPNRNKILSWLAHGVYYYNDTRISFKIH